MNGGPEMQAMNVLLVNPPIYDFTAYDFWLRPYGMLRVAGQLQNSCRLSFFNFLVSQKRDAWGRGRFGGRVVSKPRPLKDIPRKFRRFGIPRSDFQEFLRAPLKDGGSLFDAVLIQTYMTYWYQGVREVIEDIRTFQPFAKIFLGGVYATICPSHARSLGADNVIAGADLEPLWQALSIEPEYDLPYWPPGYTDVGIIKITEGCPFNCTYCATPLLWPGFASRPSVDCMNELRHMVRAGAENIAFYDDAVLFQPERILIPFLEEIIKADIRVLFHTPNALNARFMTPELAALMVKAGFASFFFGLESFAPSWHQSTGGKVHPEEFTTAVRYLQEAGARAIFTYIITGHPDSDSQELESSIRFAHQCGTRVILSEFSPIPGTVDGEKCSRWIDMEEPLSHNKTAFAIRRLGTKYLNELKDLSHSVNMGLMADG